MTGSDSNFPHPSSDGRPGQRPVHFILQRRYEIVSHLGQGGMGTVYMARDLRLANRFCVVKKLRDDFFREEDKQKALEFFEREATILSPLKHPNIVSITDYFDENENYYLVMEYIEGENLHQMLTQRGEPFSEEQVLQWARQITDVLNFLHSNDPKVIYRDLKPSNVMIDTKDRVKLVDFGIARPYAEDSDNTHVVSAGYSPPEQYWGAADPRSDIYALGATMHFLLTGQEPLALQTCSPKKINPNVSDRTDQIVQRATAQDVWLRYQSASEMLEDLVPPPVKTPFKPVQAAAAAVVLIFLLGLAGLLGAKILNKQPADTAKMTSELTKEKADIETRDLALQLKSSDLEKKTQELQKQLEKVRRYQMRDTPVAEDTGTASPIPTVAPPATPIDGSADTDSATTSGARSVAAGDAAANKAAKSVAFRETDEAQLTDPEGLAPLEEDSSKPTFPFLPKTSI